MTTAGFSKDNSLPLMADIQYMEPYASSAFNRKFKNILLAGFYTGYVPLAASGLNVLITSAESAGGLGLGSASIDTGGVQITVQQVDDATIAVPAGKSVIIALQADYEYGVLTNQVKADSTVQAAQFVTLDINAKLASNQIELCRVVIPAGTKQITQAMISTRYRIDRLIGITLTDYYNVESSIIGASATAVKAAFDDLKDYADNTKAAKGNNSDITDLNAIKTLGKNNLAIGGYVTINNGMSAVAESRFSTGGFTDPWNGRVMAIKASGGIGVNGESLFNDLVSLKGGANISKGASIAGGLQADDVTISGNVIGAVPMRILPKNYSETAWYKIANIPNAGSGANWLALTITSGNYGGTQMGYDTISFSGRNMPAKDTAFTNELAQKYVNHVRLMVAQADGAQIGVVANIVNGVYASFDFYIKAPQWWSGAAVSVLGGIGYNYFGNALDTVNKEPAGIQYITAVNALTTLSPSYDLQQGDMKLKSLSLSTALPVSSGGTGANNAAGARNNLGLGSAALMSSTEGAFDNIGGLKTEAASTWHVVELMKASALKAKTNDFVPVQNFQSGINIIKSSTGSAGTNGIYSGAGDSANYDTYNLQIASWQGLGFYDSSGKKTNIVFNLRTGDMSTKGAVNAESFNATGDANIKGTVTSPYEFVSTGANGLRIVYGNNGFILRKDAGTFYMLCADDAGKTTQWNALRPFSVDIASGRVTMANGQVLGGNTRINDTLTLANALSVANGGTGATDAAGARSNLGLTAGATMTKSDANYDGLSGGTNEVATTAQLVQLRNAAALKHLSNTFTQTQNIAAVNITGAAGTTNGLFAGAGDGAAYDKYNLQIAAWQGLGFYDTSGKTTNIVFNLRSGDMSTKGDLNAVDLNASGNISATAFITTQNEFISRGQNGLRIANGGSGVLLRKDGNTFYMLSIADNAGMGGWNELRPFAFDVSTGRVTMANGQLLGGGQTLTGGQTLSGGTTIKDTLTLDNALAIGSGGTGANNLDGARKNLQLDRLKQGDTETELFSAKGGNYLYVSENGWGAYTAGKGFLALGVGQGGTGATDAAGARNNLGLTAGATMTKSDANYAALSGDANEVATTAQLVQLRNAAALKQLTNDFVPVQNFQGGMALTKAPGGSDNSNGIFNGPSDGASGTSYNVEIRSWYGIGFRDTCNNKTNIFMNVRTGEINTTGTINAQGLTVAGNYITIKGAGVSDAMLGSGGSDVYFKNSKSNKNLQLRDDGTLQYDNKDVYHTGRKPSMQELFDSTANTGNIPAISDKDDLNNYLTAGMFRCDSVVKVVTNAPESGVRFNLTVLNVQSGVPENGTTQIIYLSSDSSRPNVYVRCYSNKVWSLWVDMASNVFPHGITVNEGMKVADGSLSVNSGLIYSNDSSHYLYLGKGGDNAPVLGTYAGQFQIKNTNGNAIVTEFKNGDINTIGNISLTTDNSILSVGNDGNMGLVKKSGTTPKVMVGTDTPFIVTLGNAKQISAASSQTDLFRVDTDGTGTLKNNLRVNGSTLTIVGAGTSNLNVGSGASDVYLQNSKTNRFLQLSDDGYLRYSGSKVYHEGNKPTTAELGFSIDSNHYFNTSDEKRKWVRVAVVNIPQGGQCAYLTIWGGAGYNAGSKGQAAKTEIIIRAGNGTPANSITAVAYVLGSTPIEPNGGFGWKFTSNNNYEIWANVRNYTQGHIIEGRASSGVIIDYSDAAQADKPDGLADGFMYYMQYGSGLEDFYSKDDADTRFVNVSGDTMTGPLNLANNAWNKLGDDVQFGDRNNGGKFCIQGLNDTTGIAFFDRGSAAATTSTYINADAGSIGIYAKNSVNIHADLDIDGICSSDGGFVSSSANGFRIANSNNGIIMRKDASSFFLLCSTESAGLGNWNTLRPFAIDIASGRVTMANGQVLAGGQTLSGNTTIKDTLTLSNALSVDNGGTGATDAAGARSNLGLTAGATMTKSDASYDGLSGNANEVATTAQLVQLRNAAALKHLSNTFTQTQNIAAVNITGAAGTTNGLFAGAGDAASYDKYNLQIAAWQGLGFYDTSGKSTNIVFNLRNGDMSTKGKLNAAEVNTTGNVNAGSYVTTKNEFISRGANGLRIQYGSNAFLLRKDSGTFYMLCVPDTGDTTTWNALRPFSVDIGTGRVTMANSQVLTGGQTLSGGTTINDTLTLTNALSMGSGGTGAADLNGARSNLQVDRLKQGGSETQLFSAKGANYLFVNDSSWGCYIAGKGMLALAIGQGGTGATDAAGARSNLGLTAGATMTKSDANYDGLGGNSNEVATTAQLVQLRNASALKHLSNTFTQSQTMAGLNISGTSSGCGMYAGNGDGADFSKQNLLISSWWGIGFHDSCNNATNIVMDTRSGNLLLKGYLQVGQINAGGNISVAWGGKGHTYQENGDIVENQGTSSIFRGFWDANSLGGALRNITNRADDAWNRANNAQGRADDAWNKANDAQGNRVQDIRLSGQDFFYAGRNVGAVRAPSGAVLVGVEVNGEWDNNERMMFAYVQKLVNGNWYTIGQA